MRAISIVISSLLVAVVLVTASACTTKRGPKDVGNENPRSEFVDGPRGSGAHRSQDGGVTATDHVVAKPEVHGRKPRELARASARAIVTSGTHVYFGDGEEDALFGLLKAPPPPNTANEPSRIARRAPMPGSLMLDEESRLVWIGSPGDIVLRVSATKGGSPTTLRDGAIFAHIAASTKGEIFFTEVQTKGGALSRITGATVARLATFDGTPRGIALDAQHVYVATSTRIVETPRQRDVVTDLATGSGFASPQVDDTWLYATATNAKGNGRILVRVKKMGGTLETIAEGVRDAPIALHKGSLYWFDATRPALLTSPTNSSGKLVPQTLSDDPVLEYVYGIAIDDDGAFIASGYGDGGRIVQIPLR